MKIRCLVLLVFIVSGFGASQALANERDACLKVHKLLVHMYPEMVNAPKNTRLRGCDPSVFAFTAATVHLIRKGTRAFNYVPTPKDVLEAAKTGNPAGVIRYFGQKYITLMLKDLTKMGDKKVSKIVSRVARAGMKGCYRETVRHIAMGTRGVPDCVLKAARR